MIQRSVNWRARARPRGSVRPGAGAVAPSERQLGEAPQRVGGAQPVAERLPDAQPLLEDPPAPRCRPPAAGPARPGCAATRRRPAGRPTRAGWPGSPAGGRGQCRTRPRRSRASPRGCRATRRCPAGRPARAGWRAPARAGAAPRRCAPRPGTWRRRRGRAGRWPIPARSPSSCHRRSPASKCSRASPWSSRATARAAAAHSAFARARRSASPAPTRSGRSGWRGQQPGQPLQALGGVAPQLPEAPQGGAQPEAVRGRAVLGEPAQRLAEVVVLPGEGVPARPPAPPGAAPGSAASARAR